MIVTIRSGFSRVIGIILGVLIICAGACCFARPTVTHGVFSWVVGLAIGAFGLGKVILYIEEKAAGFSDPLSLLSGIASMGLAIILMSNKTIMGAVDITMAYLVGIWALIAGGIRIARSFTLSGVNKTLRTHRIGSNWDISLATGVLLVICGLIGVSNPLLVILAVNWQVGATLVIAGIGIITCTF